MTFREYVLDYCDKRGMFPDQCAAVLDAIVSNPNNEAMRGRWDEDTSNYPEVVLRLTILLINRAAVSWIESNKPMAWFKPLFQPEDATR